MPRVPDFEIDAGPNVAAGNGTQTLTFSLPAAPGLKIQSVVATVTNGAASAVRPKITITDPSGEVIATTTQADSIPAGDTGTATFALRLADSTGTAGIRFDTLNQGGWLDIEASDNGPTGNEINIEAASGTMNLQSFGALSLQGDGLSFGSNGDYLLQTVGDVLNQPSGNFTAEPLGDMNLDASGSVTVRGDTIEVRLRGTSDLTVFDSGGNPLFRVDQDGDLHGLTGKSLTFDL